MPQLWIYARKSSYQGKKRGRGRSVAEQLDAGQMFAEDEGLSIGDTYVDDDRSASAFRTKSREEFERLISDIESGRIERGDTVWAYQSSRLQRDLRVYVQLRDVCRDAGVLWHYNGRTYDLSKREDRRSSAYDAISAEDQADELSEGVRRALRANARRGRPHAWGLYGYKRLYDPATGELDQVVPDPDQAPIVAEIFEALKAHRSLASIVDGLNARGVPSPKGKTWGATQIRQMAVNPSYVGVRMHNGQEAGRAMWPPLVDEATFYAVKAILGDPSRRTNEGNAVKHLLTGTSTCFRCEGPLWAHPHHSGYRQYWCESGRHVSVKADPIDDHVTGLLVRRLARKDAARLFAVTPRETERTKKLMADVERWKAELAEAPKLVKAGKLSAVGLAGLEAALLPEIEKAERQLGAARVNPLLAQLIRPTVEEVFTVWSGLELRQQRTVIRAAFDVIEVSSPGQGRRNVDPAEYVRTEFTSASTARRRAAAAEG
ncbi:recombinase family protein [Actinomadura luteofluorescens]|uniref:recombinase family protein n=1 Tax=Actinomadura luteofluorescens TaxID=46163 RepID=UPI00346D8B91